MNTITTQPTTAGVEELREAGYKVKVKEVSEGFRIEIKGVGFEEGERLTAGLTQMNQALQRFTQSFIDRNPL